MCKTLEQLLAVIDDDALADEVAKRCMDENHDTRWCPRCSARWDGIDDYREM